MADVTDIIKSGENVLKPMASNPPWFIILILILGLFGVVGMTLWKSDHDTTNMIDQNRILLDNEKNRHADFLVLHEDLMKIYRTMKYKGTDE